MTAVKLQKTAVQLCHGYKMPFFDVAQQYASTLQAVGYRVITVFLTGPLDQDILDRSVSDETIFYQLNSAQLKGLKLGLLRRFNQLCREQQTDLIVAHRAKAIYLACIGASFRPAATILGVVHAYGVFGRRNRKLLAYLNQANLRLLGVSNAIRDDIRQALPRYNKQHIQTFYNRLDFDKVGQQLYSREYSRKLLGIDEAQYAMVNVGRLHPDKDQKTLIHAFACAHKLLKGKIDNHLFIYGAGKLKHDLQHQIDALGAGNAVSLQGVLPEVWRYLRAFDGFILSSDHEPFGMVLLEAIAADLPIISSACGGAVEINQSDLQYALGDEKELSEKIQLLYQIGETQKRGMLAVNRKYAEVNFSYKNGKADFRLLLDRLSV